jgi:hypothetical protein
MVEIELSVLSRQCLDQWIPEMEKVKQETQDWERERTGKEPKFIGNLLFRMLGSS